MAIKKRKFKKNRDRDFVNRRISAPKVLCIDHNNDNVGVIPTSEALSLAEQQGLDLVQVSPPSKNNRFPTCKILDYGKYKYDQSKKLKSQAKKRRESAVKTKEVKFRPCTDVNDLTVKAKRAARFLSEGHRVKVVVNFKGRELAHKDVAFDKMQHFFELVDEYELINEPSMDGRTMVALLGSKKNVVAQRIEIAS